MQISIEEWNARYGPGTQVRRGEMIIPGTEAVTTGPAYLYLEQMPVVPIAGRSEPMPLAQIDCANPLPKNEETEEAEPIRR